jgi:hypothetical protein
VPSVPPVPRTIPRAAPPPPAAPAPPAPPADDDDTSMLVPVVDVQVVTVD